MRDAATVLSVLRERGRRGLPLERLYRQLFNPQWYLMAYGKLYSNKGAMTPGVTAETVDGMTMGKIERIIDALRHERYRFEPVRRVYIAKKNGKRRPLGLPTWSDKMVAEVVRLILEAYYEPQFSGRSHGFRHGRGCHTALREVANTWTGTTWFIEGDVTQCFDSFDQTIMIGMLGEKIHDNRFLRLLCNMLAAGYLEDWNWKATPSGVPQGGPLSPILSNIYLHQLDTFVETVLIPQYTRGQHRASNPEYQRARHAIRQAREHGDRAAARSLRKRLRGLPSQNPSDPGYRRLRYCRYADDTLLGFTGPKVEAEAIKQRLAQFLHEELKLELSQDKTLITHARSQRARFLGYEIAVVHNDRKTKGGRRTANGTVSLHVPTDVIKAKCAPYLQRGKPTHQPRLMNEDDYTIVATFGARYRGIVGYYLLAGDVHRLSRLRWVMQTSLLKTLAGKHHSTVSKMVHKFQAINQTPHGPRACLQARIDRGERKTPLIAQFAGIPLKRQKNVVLIDREPVPVIRRKELITRFLEGRCEICKHRQDVQVHHVRKLADLDRPGQPQPEWAMIMARRRRKTLVVCQNCHDSIHLRQPTVTTTQ
jgi:group II intron reverse transcriptase/maturase